MCGISVAWGPSVNEPAFKAALAALKARGPDDLQLAFTQFGNMELMYGFTRLHVQGAANTEQPFVTDTRIVMCNGEIFNATDLIRTRSLLVPAGASDCAVIPALLDQGLTLAEVARCLDGDFAIVVIDLSGTIQVARDPYGVRPLFYSQGAIASELKGLVVSGPITAVEPGTIVTFEPAVTVCPTVERWHQVPWLKAPPSHALADALIAAVYKRMATVRGIGACLSGGLDSSLVAAIAARSLPQGSCLDTYSIGMEGSPDLEAARLVAAHIGSRHHECVITAADCVSAVPRVIRAIESYDITTVRASVGNFLLAEFIRRVTPHVKVVLNGDGADEALGGYLYMREAPDDLAWEFETDRLLREIHRYDVLRSERSMAAFGLESRSPFLDRQFISVARAIPTVLLRSSATVMEKSVLRMEFDGVLPNSILWRRKEAFSDGISREPWFAAAAAKGEGLRRDYAVNPPPTAEAAWYRAIFESWYPTAASVIPAMWMPRFVVATDPSARTLSLYNQ
jgi:asparagine synthase (glutamine-hydrolysing)